MTATLPERTGAATGAGEARLPSEIRPGWHVRVGGEWLLVQDVPNLGTGEILIRFAATPGREPLDAFFDRIKRVDTRTPEEQIAHVGALWPGRGPALRRADPGPMATLYGGSAPSGPFGGAR